MGVTVNVNGLSQVHKGSGGVVMATIPDICKTPAPPGPPVPIPYPNIAMSSDLMKGTNTVKVDGCSAAVKGSEFFKSTGDEPGVAGGVKSGVNMSKATWLLWSPNVFYEGKNACRLTDKMLMNKGNTVSLGGEMQMFLTQADFLAKLEEYACECKCDASQPRKQDCLSDKFREGTYDGEYPKPGTNVLTEVGMMDGPGGFKAISNKAGTGPTSHPIRGGSIIPDFVLTDGQPPTPTGDGRLDYNISTIVETKFPPDVPNANQDPTDYFSKYNQAARDNGADYQLLYVPSPACKCPGEEPDPVPVPAEQRQEQEDEGVDWGKVGAYAGVGVGLVALAAITYFSGGTATPATEPAAAALLGLIGLGAAAGT